MFKILDNSSTLEVFNFPDGESCVKFDYNNKPITIVWYYENDAELMVLAQIFDVIKEKDPKSRMPKNLFIPYVPHARQDRRTTSNQPSSLDLFWIFLDNIVNNKNVDVYCLDIHNAKHPIVNTINRYRDIPGIRLNNIKSYHYAKNIDISKYDSIIVPDKGATERCSDWWNHTRDTNSLGTTSTKLIYCTKNRDPNTGRLSIPSIDKDLILLKDLHKINYALLIDDIGTGFGTHIQLAEYLKKENPELLLDIWVTHASFVRGTDDIFKYFSHVYTTDSLISGKKYHNDSRITAFDCTQFLPKVM